jgi:hypothetical protein
MAPRLSCIDLQRGRGAYLKLSPKRGTLGPGGRPRSRNPAEMPALDPSYVFPAAQTRIVSVATIWLVARKSARPFKGIIFPDVSEFESYMPSHAVGLWASSRQVAESPVFKVMRKVREQEKPLGLGAACGNECSAALARFGNMRRRQFRRDHLVRDFGDAAHCPCRHDSIDIVILNGNGRRRAFNEP